MTTIRTFAETGRIAESGHTRARMLLNGGVSLGVPGEICLRTRGVRPPLPHSGVEYHPGGKCYRLVGLSAEQGIVYDVINLTRLCVMSELWRSCENRCYEFAVSDFFFPLLFASPIMAFRTKLYPTASCHCVVLCVC